MLLSQATHDSKTYNAIANWAAVCDRDTASRQEFKPILSKSKRMP